MRYLRCLISLLFLLWATSSSIITSAQAPLASWTILVYLDGDNNLERDAIDDFLEMATVGSSADVNVIVQFDRVPGYDYRYGDWEGTLRFRVTRGMTPDPGYAMADLGELNMGDPQTLVDFVNWGRSAFPAQRTALVLWNHGDGWRPASMLKEGRKAICWDATSANDALDLAELRWALSQITQNGASSLDLLAFDACLMAMIEVDAQIQPYVDIRVASEETEPGTGYPFDTILTDLTTLPSMDAATLGRIIVERYYEAYGGETQSTADLGDGYLILIAAVDELAGALVEHQQTELNTVRAVRLTVQQFQSSYVDLRDFATKLAAATGDGTVRNAAQQVIDAVDGVVLAERHGVYWPGAYGVSIYFPAQANQWDSQYSGENDYLVFTDQTRWDDFLMLYLELGEACEPDIHEPDDGPALARPIEVNGKSQRHTFCPATDAADWVSFQAEAGQTFDIATLELEAYCDTVLKLYDRDGQTLIEQDDDGGPGWASQIQWTSPAAGTYYVEVMEYFGRAGQDTGYTLRVTSTSAACQADTFEPDNDPATATPLSVDGPAQTHNFCPQGDGADWVSFQATAGQAYLVETSDLGAECDTTLTLYDPTGTTILLTEGVRRNNVRAASSQLRWTCPATGRYFVRVQEQQGRTGENTSYQIGVSMVSMTVSGQVQLQGRTLFDGTEIIIQPFSDTLPSFSAQTTISGTFALDIAHPCTITASHPGYLPAQWKLSAILGPQLELEPATLLGGDVTGDNEINILDISYVGARFGGHEVSADITGDGVVDILDLVLTASNFGQAFVYP